MLFGSHHWRPLFSVLKRTQRRAAERVEEVSLQTKSLFVKPLAGILVREYSAGRISGTQG